MRNVKLSLTFLDGNTTTVRCSWIAAWEAVKYFLSRRLLRDFGMEGTHA